MLVTFNEAYGRNEAQELVNKEILDLASFLADLTPSILDLSERWLGWCVSSDRGVLGTVDEIIQTPANDVLQIKGDSGEWLIPVIDDYILNEDAEAKALTVKHPDMV